jgi:hypothetical protein
VSIRTFHSLVFIIVCNDGVSDSQTGDVGVIVAPLKSTEMICGDVLKIKQLKYNKKGK